MVKALVSLSEDEIFGCSPPHFPLPLSRFFDYRIHITSVGIGWGPSCYHSAVSSKSIAHRRKLQRGIRPVRKKGVKNRAKCQVCSIAMKQSSLFLSFSLSRREGGKESDGSKKKKRNESKLSGKFSEEYFERKSTFSVRVYNREV